MTDWVAGNVVNLKRWTEQLYSVQLRADIAPFTAGQFTRLALEIDGEMIARPYSFVNGPADPVHEFYFVRVPGGPLTARMIKLQTGDTLYIAPRAAGFFILSEIPAAETLWMLSTGTALGPFLSILTTAAAWQNYRHIVLVHAVRTAAELTYTDRIQALLAAHAGQLQYLPFVSREQVPTALPGRVTAAIEGGLLERQAGLPLTAETSQVMICGNPGMVSDTQTVLEARGLKKNRRREPGQITTEQYWKK
jgi:ferredoxin/flavodoxin---NADP+ reductase